MYHIYLITPKSYDIITLANKQSDFSELRNTNSGKNYAKQTELNELLVYNMKVLLFGYNIANAIERICACSQNKIIQ